MDYDLTRIDYTICGITYPDTMKILPSLGPKLQKKITVGDKNGVLQCISVKDEEPVVQFKTLPGKPITSVQLAATAGTQADKIFAASGNEVKGYTRKGKVFLTIETTLSDTITSMCVLGADLILGSGRTVTYYRDLRELHTYVCEDRVLDIAAFATPNSTRVRLLVLIANKGAIILDGGQVVTRTAISSGPSRLAIPNSSHGSNMHAFYGAADGSIGVISYEESVLSSQCLVEGRGLGSVVCLGWFFGYGGTHLAVGRHDGSIQLYLLDMENLAGKPRLKYTYFCGEPVTSIGGGCVGVEENELLVATFSGRIFALRSSRLISGASVLSNIPHDALAARRTKLESEVARLEKQVINERDKYQRNTRSLQAGLSTPPLLDVQHELSGATHDGWQELQIISAVPLDMLFVYCNKKLDTLTDSAAVLSVCPSQINESDLLATVRCQAGTRRLWIRLRQVHQSSEQRAQSVRVLIYALPAGAPRVARLITVQLPALPHYSQHEDPEVCNEKRAWCQLRVSGGFSVAEMSAWLSEALPGDLPRPAASIDFARRDTLLGTVIACQYQRGFALFKSDNVSTIAVIKNIMSNCLIQKSIRVEITHDIPADCCIKSFRRIEEIYKEQYNKNKDIILKNAISCLDLDTNTMDAEAPILCEEYQRVWDDMASENKENLNFYEIVDTIEQWYTDWRSFAVLSVDQKNRRSRLKEALQECVIEEIVNILSNEPSSPQEYY